MRLGFVFLALAAVALAPADRLSLAPLGKKVPFGTFRLEHMFDQAEHGRSRTALAVGLTESVDAELTWERGEGKGKVLSFDLSYNIVPPITDLTPGFSIGLRDGLGETRDDRFFYGAVTHKFGQTGVYSGEVPVEATMGLAIGDRVAPFFALSLPFRPSFRVLAEFDTVRVSGGLEYRPVDDLWVRWIHREDQSLWSVTLVKRL
jgi:hypothetical protein